MWQVRTAESADAEAVEDFLVDVPEFRGLLLPLEQRVVWRWLYSRGGTEIGDVLIAQKTDGPVIAHYGISRLPYVVAGQKIEAGMACLLAVDEAYRKTPLFLQLTTRLLKSFRASGRGFITGLANRSGLLEFHKAFGFTDVGEVPIFAKPIRIRSIVDKLLKQPWPRLLAPFTALAQWAWLMLLRQTAARGGSVRLVHIERFDEATAATSAQLAAHHQYYADRADPAVLNTRFFEIPCRDYLVYKIVRDDVPIGYVALRIMDMMGYRAIGIVDICYDFAQKDVGRAVFRALDRLAIDERADLISILTNSRPLIAHLRAAVYLRAPESFRLVVFEPANALRLAASNIGDWFITWFEHDFV